MRREIVQADLPPILILQGYIKLGETVFEKKIVTRLGDQYQNILAIMYIYRHNWQLKLILQKYTGTEHAYSNITQDLQTHQKIEEWMKKFSLCILQDWCHLHEFNIWESGTKFQAIKLLQNHFGLYQSYEQLWECLFPSTIIC